MFTIDLSLLISLWTRQRIGYQHHRKWVAIRTMQNFDSYGKQYPAFRLVCSSISTRLMRNKLYFFTVIACSLHPLSVTICSGKWYLACWWFPASTGMMMCCMTIIALGLIWHSMEYEPKHILTWGSNSTCLGEIWLYQCLSLPVWRVWSGNPVNVNETWSEMWISFANWQLSFHDILASSVWLLLFHRPLNGPIR